MRILNKTPKTHNARHGKGGFTLVELCVVLALLVMLAVGITSFSTLMNGFAAEASEETAFWEENAALKSELRRWIAENDVKEESFYIQNGVLYSTNSAAGQDASFYLAGSALIVNGVQKAEYSAIDGIVFATAEGSRPIMKCTVYYITEYGERKAVDFLFSVRAAGVSS